MDKLKVTKVDDVTLWKKGIHVKGTLHLTTHHLIFRYVHPAPTASNPNPPNQKQRETWITYPMINYCTYRPSPAASHLPPILRLQCRDFTFVAFHFKSEAQAREVYDSIRSLSCKIGSLKNLSAFSYHPSGPEAKVNGWEVYDARQEWKRMGISPKDTNKGWRISDINVEYKYASTYPALLVVPSTISDNVLRYAAEYRSRQRIPALTYRHPTNNCSITRSSQPMSGYPRKRSAQDEKLVAAIFNVPKDASSAPQPDSQSSEDSGTLHEGVGGLDLGSNESSYSETEAVEDQAIAQASQPTSFWKTAIFGATARNLIVDARPTINAVAMQVVGRGSENMDHYKDASKAYLGIDNIHVMRSSLNKVIEALKDSDLTTLVPNKEQLAKSGWLQHLHNLLDGSALIARTIEINCSNVLIHCSDGWDRTSQLSALSQICLDPYYRTIEGFIVLIEKDWLSFGHMFRQRSGFLGHEKWFEIEGERVDAKAVLNGGAGGNNAFGGVLLSAKGLFKKNESKDSLTDSEGEFMASATSDPASKQHISGDASPKPPSSYSSADEKPITKPREVSPVFHQFLDSTYQLLYQHPTRFEFNERFLRRLLYHLYSCQYGTFLYDSEKERHEARVTQRTRSVWDYFLARRAEFTNPQYDATIDDNVRGKERLLLPRLKEIRWWAEAFGRLDEEMNGSVHEVSHQERSRSRTPVPPETRMSKHASPAAGSRAQDAAAPPPNMNVAPVLTAVETAERKISVQEHATSRDDGGAAENAHLGELQGGSEDAPLSRSRTPLSGGGGSGSGSGFNTPNKTGLDRQTTKDGMASQMASLLSMN